MTQCFLGFFCCGTEQVNLIINVLHLQKLGQVPDTDLRNLSHVSTPAKSQSVILKV